MKEKLFCLIIGCFFSTLIAGIFLYFYLPFYLGSSYIPKAGANIGINVSGCEIRNIGFTGAELSSIEIGGTDSLSPSLLLSSLRIDYSPSGIYHGEIEKIALSGLEFHCLFDNGRFSIPGIDIESIQKKTSSAKKNRKIEKSKNNSPPIFIRHIEVSQSLIVFQQADKQFRLPFEGDIFFENKNPDIFSVNLRIYPENKKIQIIADIDLKKSDFKLYISSLTGIYPLPVQIFDIDCQIESNAEKQKIFGIFGIFKIKQGGSKVSPKNESKDFWLITPESTIKLTAEYLKNGQWSFELKNAPSKSAINLKSDELKLTTGLFKIEIAGMGKNGTGKIDYNISIPNIRTKQSKLTTHTPVFSLNGSVAFAPPGTKKTSGQTQVIKTDTKIKIPAIEIISSGKKIEISELQAHIPLSWPPEGLGKKGNVNIKSIRLNDQDTGRFNLSIRQYAPDRQDNSGKKYNNSGQQQNTDRPKNPGILFSGAYDLAMPRGMKIEMEGKSAVQSPDPIKTHIIIKSDFSPKSPLDMGSFMKSASGTTIDGRFQLNCDISVENQKIDSSMRIKADNARISNTDLQIKAAGIYLDFFIPNIMLVQSAPKQSLRFSTFGFKDLELSDGRFEFKTEHDGAIFLEKSSVKWCNGNVHLYGFRIQPGTNDYELTLHCDRMNLAMLLMQFGISNAEGEGTVNGKIPIRVKNGKFIFDDGFLYSTPGDGGIIHVTGTEILLAGIPKQSLQYAQIDLAREALKDFEYKWVKMRLSSKGEDLKVNLQFDGKPANPLPFEYQTEIGGFARVGANSPGSRFQGIRLDINLSLPLDRLLAFQDLIKMIQQ